MLKVILFLAILSILTLVVIKYIIVPVYKILRNTEEDIREGTKEYEDGLKKNKKK